MVIMSYDVLLFYYVALNRIKNRTYFPKWFYNSCEQKGTKFKGTYG